nr:hypothetical protein [Tanacetum cinerariifolium]
EATDDSPAVPEHTTLETPTNMSQENKAHFLAEKEAIHLILTGMRDDIDSTIDACQTTQEMWEAIERLQQGESLNIQDAKINLFWEFSKFTSQDGETMDSYYTRFYKLMNEMIRNNLTVTTMQPEWSRNANPLALVATAQASQDPYYQTPRSHRSSAPSPKPSSPSRSHMTTRHKGKEIAKPITPPSETASEEDSNLKQAQRDKDMQKNLAIIAKYFKKIYKPTNNNLRTSSNSKNKNVDMTPRENVGSKVVQQYGIQCFNCKEYGHFAKECRKPKRYDWLADTNKEVDEQELEAHYSYVAKIQEVPTTDSGTNSKPVEHVQNEAGYNVFANHLQHSEQSEYNEQNDVEIDDERVALVNLIDNLKLNTKQAEFEKFKAFNDRTINYDKLECKLNEALGQLAHKDTVIREGLKTKAYELSVVKEKHDELMKQSLLTMSHYEGLVKQKTKGKSMDTKFDRPSVVRQPNAQRIPKPPVLGKPTPFLDSLERKYFPKTKSVPKANVSQGLSKPVTTQTLPQTAKKAVSNTNVLKPGIPQLKSNQLRDKVLPNNSQVKAKKTQVEVHPRIPSVFNKTKSVTACKDSLNSRTLNDNVVCATCNKCLIDSNHFACVTKMLNDMHARTKKPTVVPISTRKPKSKANKSIATPNKKKVASKSTIQKPHSYFRVLYENTNKAWKWWIQRQSQSGYKWVPKTKKQ